MKLKIFSAIVLLWSYAITASANVAPEIDGSLSIQAIGLMGGLLFLMKKKKNN